MQLKLGCNFEDICSFFFLTFFENFRYHSFATKDMYCYQCYSTNLLQRFNKASLLMQSVLMQQADTCLPLKKN